jgi:hypothetical protein
MHLFFVCKNVHVHCVGAEAYKLNFLCFQRMNVMDYSLFVGVDKQKKELVFGIIDYLRQYTWDKQL